jgi:hypothetical protein
LPDVEIRTWARAAARRRQTIEFGGRAHSCLEW